MDKKVFWKETWRLCFGPTSSPWSWWQISLATSRHDHSPGHLWAAATNFRFGILGTQHGWYPRSQGCISQHPTWTLAWPSRTRTTGRWTHGTWDRTSCSRWTYGKHPIILLWGSAIQNWSCRISQPSTIVHGFLTQHMAVAPQAGQDRSCFGPGETNPWGRASEPNPVENVWQTLWFASPTRRVGSKYPLVCLAINGTKARKWWLCLWTCGLSKIHENVSTCWYLRIDVMGNDQKLFFDMEHIKKPMGCFSHQHIRNYS